MAAADFVLAPHPYRQWPVEPRVRTITRRLYEAVRHLPVISSHRQSHPRPLLDDEPFPDPATSVVLAGLDAALGADGAVAATVQRQCEQ